ncbi:MAG: lasso peptide biosynthesis protein [Planctomycetes bacterium]|nr:lasso peptide biosynthesis protein [Planctomycetota bacterium]
MRCNHISPPVGNRARKRVMVPSRAVEAGTECCAPRMVPARVAHCESNGVRKRLEFAPDPFDLEEPFMTRASRRLWTSLCILLAIPLVLSLGCRGGDAPRTEMLASTASAPKPVDELIEERWDLMRMVGSDVGYVHTTIRKKSDASGPLFETAIETKVSMKRLGAAIEVAQSSTTLERESGELVRIHTVSKQSAKETITDVTFSGGKAQVVTDTFGSKHESTLNCPPDALGPYKIQRLAIEKGLKPGTTYDAKTFAAEVNGPATAHVTIIGPEETELLDGKKETLTKLETTLDVMPMFKTSEWVAENGDPMKTSVPMMGLKIETFSVNRERALSGSAEAATLSPDVFAKTLVTSKELIPNPRTTESALLRIRPKSADVNLPNLEDARQAVESKEAGGTILLRNRRTVPPPGKTGTRPLRNPSAELADFLAPNPMIQSDAPDIVKVANDVVGDETDAWKASQKLERWVDDNVTNKNMDVAFASALEVCKNRSGDCTEHSVFLAALCRAAGIPARPVMGLEYVGGVWGGHAWDEVWIDGEWYALDATNGYGFVDPLHLAFSKMSLKDGSFAKEFGNLLAGIGNIDIDVVEITSKGRTLRPSDDDVVKIDGNRYTNRLWSLALTKPDGFTFQPRKAAAEISNELLRIEGKSPSGADCSIQVTSAYVPAEFKPSMMDERFTSKGAASIGEVVIDGRKGKGFADEAKKRRAVYVIDGESLYVFAADGVATPEDTAVFDAFLKSIDFDATEASKN